MKKNNTFLAPKTRRLLLLFLFASILPARAVDVALPDSLVFESRQLTVEQVIDAITDQLKYEVFYNESFDDKRVVQLPGRSMSLDEVLRYLLGEGLTYKIEQGAIIISPLPRKQQNNVRRVSGAVKDERGQPLPGVNAWVEGTTVGVSAGREGQFTIALPAGARVLVFSFVGMETQRVDAERLRDGESLEVVMKESIAELGGAVVVTGIFTKARESYTGAVSTISARELQVYKGQNLVQTRKNIDPSINITADNALGSDPNALPQINLRGNSSLPMSVQEYNEGLKTNVNTPLIIMDGFEISLTKLVDYNDEEIESINILKDAAATAIYGSRGANGVIVIITKAPRAGQLKVNAQAGLNLEFPDLGSYDLLNAAELLALQKEVGLYDWEIPALDRAETSYYARLKDVLEGVNTDWLHYPVQTGVGQRYNLRVEGGSDEFRWGASLGYNQTAGAMKKSARDNFNGSIILSYTYKDVIFRNQLSIGQNKAVESPYGVFSAYVDMPPYYKPYENGKLLPGIVEGLRVENPLYDATLNTRDDSRYTEIINHFSIEWLIRPGLRLRGQFGVSEKTSESNKYLPPEHSTFLISSLYETEEGYFRKGRYDYSTGRATGYDANLTLSYSKVFREKHNLYAGFDYSIQASSSYQYLFALEGFASEKRDFPGSAMQYEQDGLPGGSESAYRRVGFTGNLNYIYDNRYYADLSYRVDGSSQFGSDQKFAPFWSAGVGWNIHREAFLEGKSALDLLRVRLSYGQTGSQQFSAYQALQTYSYFAKNKYLNRGGAYLMALGNERLKWQITDQFNTGIEATLMNNRLNAAFDYYVKTTDGLLSSRDLPRSSGFASYADNIGAVKNWGFEASLNYYLLRDARKELIWTVGAKLAYTKNEITKLSDAVKEQNEVYKAQDVDVSTLFYEGFPQNSIWAVRSLGIDPSTGKELFLDADDNITETFHPAAKVFCGVSEPLYRGNLTSMLRYKGLSLNLSFGYHWGGKQVNNTLKNRVEIPISTLATKNADRRVLSERWHKPGDVTFFKAFSNALTRETSRFVMDDRVFELQSATFQWRVDRAGFLRGYGLQSILFSVNASDLFYFSTIKRERGTSYPFARRTGASVALIF
ncbi:MAG: SusC/RagA family TonB-linked outer membrane protein [Odoribacteraceae bacterium]|jgi:TonB-linked SusC/RagA family outer membrane protein|nr:SusC/RagA family TonB-linked outer membrane protein [Odoribacteraceae bacterium]